MAAYSKAIGALDEFEALVLEYEMLLDTQQALVRTANFAGLFEMASRGDRLARDAALCGKRITPLVTAVASGQFTGPRANEIRRRSLSARSSAEAIDGSAARLAALCSQERDGMSRRLRGGNSVDVGASSGLPSAYRAESQRFLDRRG